MTRLLPIVFCITLMTMTVDAEADGQKVKRVSPGQIAWHFVINLTDNPFGPPDLVGYISAIEGVNGPMFQEQDCPSLPITTGCVENAFFTLRVRPLSGTPPTILLTADANVGGVVLSDLIFDIYLDRTPNQTWDNFDSFTDGELIATFSESDLQAATTSSGGAFTLFSSKLTASQKVYYHGQIINFRRMVPHGVTSTNFGQADSGAAFGTAIAIGRKN